MNRGLRSALALLAVNLASCSSCDEETPPDDTFDGNVVIGDASTKILDAEVDSGIFDAGTEPDAGFADAGHADAGLADADLPDSGDECLEPSVALLTASTAAAQADKYAGSIVEVTGTATRTALACTEIPCTPQQPCCNTCTATVTIGGLVTLLPSTCTSSAPGCAGNECNHVCRPTLDIPQRFRGVMVDDAQIGAGLMLHSVAP